MTSVYYFNLDENIEYDLPSELLSHCKKKESSAAASALINMGTENLRYTENGKPVADNCFVSISHSEKVIAVCKSDVPVGIDIEVFGKKRDWVKIAKRYFSENELQYFSKSPNEKTFLEIWTKKEAFAKISGNGIADIINGVDVFSLDGFTFETELVNNFIITVCEKVGI